jgi:hypothetical protein
VYVVDNIPEEYYGNLTQLNLRLSFADFKDGKDINSLFAQMTHLRQLDLDYVDF